jgi:hypothetical protein
LEAIDIRTFARPRHLREFPPLLPKPRGPWYWISVVASSLDGFGHWRAYTPWLAGLGSVEGSNWARRYGAGWVKFVDACMYVRILDVCDMNAPAPRAGDG